MALLSASGIGAAGAAEAGAAAAGTAAAAAGAAGAATAGTAAAGAATAGSLASTLATVGEIATAAGGLVSAVGGIESAGAQGKSAAYQAQVLENDRALAKQNAALAGAGGEQQIEAQGLKTKAEIGAIKASQAASNVDVNSGSALDVQSSAAALGELNALTTRANTAKTVYGYQTQGISFGNQAELARAEAEQAPVAGAIGATGSLLSAASSVGNQYLRWQQAAGNPAGLGNPGGGSPPPQAVFP